MKRKKLHSFFAGYFYSSRKLFWDWRFVFFLLLFIPFCFAIPFILITDPIMFNEKGLRDFGSFPTFLETAKQAFKVSGDPASLERLTYFNELVTHNVFLGGYFVLGKQGIYAEPSLFSSTATRLLMVFPFFFSFFSILMAYSLFYEEGIRNSLKNIAGANIHKNAFNLGKTCFYFLILLIVSLFFTGAILFKEDKRKLMEFSNGIWQLSTSKALQIWLVQSMFCILNCMVIGAIILVLGRFFKNGSHFALLVTILFVCLATIFSIFAISLKYEIGAHKSLAPLSWCFVFGPFFPEASLLKIAVWFAEWIFLLVILFSIGKIKSRIEKRLSV